jgi:hypothetical protein
MPQESSTVQWDPIYVDGAPSTISKIYVLFLFFACVVTLFNLVRVCRTVPPFSNKIPIVPSAYVKMLQTCACRFGRWIGLIFLAWGLLTSTSVYNLCRGLLVEKTTGRNQILLMIQDFSTTLIPALGVVLFVFLPRWRILDRIDGFMTTES